MVNLGGGGAKKGVSPATPCYLLLGVEGQPEWFYPGYNQRPPPRPASQCKEWMRNYCTPAMQGRGMFMEWDVRNVTSHAQTMAAFLVTRPPVAFIGSYIMRGPGENGPPHGPAFDPLFLLDVGEPEGLCSEERPGIFQRHWSKGVAALDCNTYTATLNFSSL